MKQDLCNQKVVKKNEQNFSYMSDFQKKSWMTTTSQRKQNLIKASVPIIKM